MKTPLLISSLLLMILFSSCSTSNKTNTSVPKTRNFEEISHGDFSNLRERVLLVSNSIDVYEEKHGASFIQKNKLDEIDFTKNMLIAIYIGERSSGGYQIIIDKIEEDKEHIKVYYSIKAPDGIATTVMTQPYRFIQTSKSIKSVLFYEDGKEMR